tara:strand:+ start:123 stop:521 length:399 start_codon:yes stop_codon:yes gene_type:complete
VNIFKAATLLVPQIIANYDDETRHNKVAATWTDQEGYRTTYGVEFRAVHNSERIAIEHGQRQANGSFVYVAPNGNVHICTAERFMAIAKAQAEQATHQQQRKQPHAAHDQYTQYASGEPTDPNVQYVNVTAH